MSEKLKYPQIDTTYMQVLKGSECVIILKEKYLEFFSWSENKYLNGDSDVWEDKYFYNKATIPKDKITAIEINFNNTEKLYQVQVVPSDTFLVHFNSKEEANTLYQKLTDWKFN